MISDEFSSSQNLRGHPFLYLCVVFVCIRQVSLCSLLPQVVLPDLAVVRIGVYEESGRQIGHRVLPVLGLRPGYRHVSLRNESGQFLTLPSLFVHVRVQDYVPDRFSDFAEALANPIRYQSEQERRTQQLKVLTGEEEEEENEGNQDDLKRVRIQWSQSQ